MCLAFLRIDYFVQREEMEQDAQEKIEETKDDIDEAVHNPVGPLFSIAISCGPERPALDCSSSTQEP